MREDRAGKAETGYSGRALTAPDPWLPVPAVITDVRHETHDVATYTLALRDPVIRRRYFFLPGQFNMLGFFGVGEAPISISSDPGCPDALQHTVRSVGDVTSVLSRLKEGDVVGLRGPFGRPWPMQEAEGQDLLVVAGGIGLASLRPVLEQAFRERDRYGRITLLYGAKTPHDLVFTADFDRWRAQPDAQILLAVDRTVDEPWPHAVGVVPVLFEKVDLAPARTVAMVCGPEVMMRFVAADLLKRRLAPQRLFLSYERRMRCGVAQCGHCFLGPKFVCQDGPVFRYTQLYGLFVKGA